MNHLFLSILPILRSTVLLLDTERIFLNPTLFQRGEIGLLDLTNIVLGVAVIFILVGSLVRIEQGIVRLIRQRKARKEQNEQLLSLLQDVGVTMHDGGTDLLNDGSDSGDGEPSNKTLPPL